MSRHADLLDAVADELEEGKSPLNHTFLVEHDVTADECMDLADSLALSARLLVWAMRNPRKAVVAAQGAGDFLLMDAITRALSKR